MSETLNNNTEQAPSDGAVKTEYPPFDKQAAEEARAQRVAKYKAEHPDAVEDIDKARAMAEAEYPHRENMQDIRNYIIKQENPSYVEKLPESQKDAFQLSAWSGDHVVFSNSLQRPILSDSSREEFALQNEEAKANQAAQRAAAEYDAHKQEMEHIRQNADTTRIEDIDKAQYMAEAEDREREKEINVQNAIRQQRRDPGYQFGNISDEQKRAEFEASATRGRADIRYQEEFLKNTNQPHDFESAAKSTLEMHKRAAEQAGEEAGEQYDRLH